MTWTVRLHTFPVNVFIGDVRQYCDDAAARDRTFKYVMEVDTGKIKHVTISCTSRDHAYKRGVLFHHKFSCFFEVEWVTE